MMEDRDMDTIAEELVPSNPIILPEVKNSLDDEKKKSSIPHLYMWDANGNPVDDTESAHFVWLENRAAAKYFLETAGHEGDQLYEGIEEEDTGLFMWNSWNLVYQPVQAPKGLIRVLTFLQTFGKF